MRMSMRRLPPRLVPAISRQKLMNWLMMVARAAPPMPMWNTKIKMGSSTMLITAPEAIPIMA